MVVQFGLMQALFSSTLGVWQNRSAFAYNALLWASLVLGLSLTVSTLAALSGLGSLLPLIAMPLGLLLSTVFYSSLYFTFIDCFMFVAPKDSPDESEGESEIKSETPGED